MRSTSSSVCANETNSASNCDGANNTPRDNISLRTEWFDDTVGQRTGVAAVYEDLGIGLQHWLSPQIELRPEITWYHASVPAFDDGTKTQQVVVSGDAIIHF